MWARTALAICVVTCARGQLTHTDLTQHGLFEWGWQQQPGDHAGTIGHYYVKLPQAEQRVNYLADGSGYHTAVAVNGSDGGRQHVAHFALGQRALELAQQQGQQFFEHTATPLPQATPELQPNSGQPLDIFILQQQFSSPSINEQLVELVTPNNLQYGPQYYPQNQVNYNILTEHVQTHDRKEGNFEQVHENDSSKPLPEEGSQEQIHQDFSESIVQVFKNHNCTDDGGKQKVAEQETTKLFPQSAFLNPRNINGNFGVKDLTQKATNYKAGVHFTAEPQRTNARSERYYYTTVSPTTKRPNEEERISRLVASTQDLISNEDLLKINHAEEKPVNPPTDDIIKPKPRYSFRVQQNRYEQRENTNNGYREQNYYHQEPQVLTFDHHSHASTPRSRITVKAKIGNIVDSEIQHVDNTQTKEQLLETSKNEYKFASPIVVQDPNYENYKEQIVNNLVSTMVPYIENGYEIVGVRESNIEKTNDADQHSNEGLINVTPRPVGQKYLAPITVALRLLNANDSASFNYLDYDPDVSDSEIVTKTVEKEQGREKTVVEIQESIPVSITHYNGVEVHEYMEDGRANKKGPFDYAKSIYNMYMEAMQARNERNNENIHNSDKTEKNFDYSDAKENLESSENIQTEVEVKPNEADTENERREFVRDYYDDGSSEHHKIIQPIIIEKQVPVTQFVDRYIEKKVPYPHPVEVRVPVARPYPVPVPYEKIVEKPYEVTRYVDKPYPVEVPKPYPVEVKVPYPVEQKVYVDRPVPYTVEKVVEKQIVQQVPVPTPVAVPVEVQVPVEHQVLYPVPIETPVAVPVEVEKRVPVDRVVTKEVPVPYPVEKRVPYPVHYETKVPVPYPVEKIVDRPVPVTKYVEKPVHVEVPVPRPVPVAVHVDRPYPVDRIVEKKVPYPVHVDHIVEKKIPVPYPVETVVEKVVEKPVVVTKYKPYPVEKRVPYPVEKIVEKKVPYPVPVEIKVPYPVQRVVEKPIHVPVRVPYVPDKPYAIYQYGQGYGQQYEGSQNHLQYTKYTPEQHKNGIPPPHLRNHFQNNQDKLHAQYAQYVQNLKDTQIAQYYQDLKDKQHREQIAQYYQDVREKQQSVVPQHYQHLKSTHNQPVQTTHWGNLYASSYQHINNTPDFKTIKYKKSPVLSNYISYVTNQNPQYYGNQNQPYYGPPPASNYNQDWERNEGYVEQMRRTDRQPKNLKIEYGGFKPPLIPSTEVDLDGMPVKKDTENTN